MISDKKDFNQSSDILKLIIEHGIKDLAPVIETILNEAMKIERAQALKAFPYERSEHRMGYANGFKEKNYNSRFGKLKVQIPQVRGMSFYPKSLEKGDRTERALKLAIAEMYVQGVSTRKVAAITEELCGFDISSTQVSRCAALLDEELEKFRNRTLNGKYAYLYLDANYKKVRHNQTVIDMATLTAIGVNQDGKREILGISSRLSEGEVHWRDFLKSLVSRGLSGLELVISDDHTGLKAARRAIFPSVKWQRCQFHMAQNAQGYAPKKSMKEELGEAVRNIFHSSDYEMAQEQKRRIIEKYKTTAPEFVNWLENNIEEGLTCFSFPKQHRKRIRTTNVVERLNREIKRRTRVAVLFPNVASCERLITAVLQGFHEEWITGKQYLNMELLERKT